MGQEKILYYSIRAEENFVTMVMTGVYGNCQWYGAGLTSVFCCKVTGKLYSILW